MANKYKRKESLKYLYTYTFFHFNNNQMMQRSILLLTFMILMAFLITVQAQECSDADYNDGCETLDDGDGIFFCECPDGNPAEDQLDD